MCVYAGTTSINENDSEVYLICRVPKVNVIVGIPGYTLITKDQDGGGGGGGAKSAKSSGTEGRCSHNLLTDQLVGWSTVSQRRRYIFSLFQLWL